MVAGSAFGVLGHFWYTFLDSKFPGKAVKTVLKKLLLEMAVGPPIFGGFFLGIGYLEGKPVKDSLEEFKKNFWIICAVSNFTHIFNFYLFFLSTIKPSLEYISKYTGYLYLPDIYINPKMANMIKITFLKSSYTSNFIAHKTDHLITVCSLKVLPLVILKFYFICHNVSMHFIMLSCILLIFDVLGHMSKISNKARHIAIQNLL